LGSATAEEWTEKIARKWPVTISTSVLVDTASVALWQCPKGLLHMVFLPLTHRA